MRYIDNIFVASDQPGMNALVKMYRILFTQLRVVREWMLYYAGVGECVANGIQNVLLCIVFGCMLCSSTRQVNARLLN